MNRRASTRGAGAIRAARALVGWCLVALATAGPARAAERYVLVVTGAAGTPEHAESHATWVQGFVETLTGPLELPGDHVVVLRGGEARPAELSTADNVRKAIEGVRSRMGGRDLLCIVLVGHGTFDGVDAKFNLVGPDLESTEWRDLLARVPGQLVVVNTTAASAPFLRRLAGPGRVIITATDSAAQRYDTVFPEFFLGAFGDPEADLDKDGRVSVGEAFNAASMRTRRWYEQRGRLSTERALLDDDGDGIGKEAGAPGSDGAVASRVFLDRGPTAAMSADPAVSELIARRDVLEASIEELKRKRGFMPAGDYERELERLLIDLARISRQIRSRS